MAKSPLHHRTKEFIAILDRVKKGLSFLFQTTQPSYVLAASGTGAMEASLVNMLNPGDEAIFINGGKFGERWGKVCASYGIQAHPLNVEWGHSAKPEDVKALLAKHPAVKAVLFTASETSTGVYHPVKEIVDTVRASSDALTAVDAITALGVKDLPMDAWGIDCVVSGSQKALMLPPGLAFLAMSERARARRKEVKTPRFYFNLDAEDKAAIGGETAWTPAVSLICGLDLVLQKMQKSGLQAIFAHHAKLARGVKGMDLKLFAKDVPSDSVTSVHVPDSVPEGKKIISHLRDTFGITVAGGQDQWKGKMFRLAHLGYYDALDMMTMLSALEMTLHHLGHGFELGKGPAAASRIFLQSE